MYNFYGDRYVLYSGRDFRLSSCVDFCDLHYRREVNYRIHADEELTTMSGNVYFTMLRHVLLPASNSTYIEVNISKILGSKSV